MNETMTPKPALLPEADYAFLRQLVFEHSQNVLDPSRDYLFETRLARLMRQQGMAGLPELVAKLRARRDVALTRAVGEAMTINETSFFRDSRPFELLRLELIPKLMEARKREKTLAIWSAACSTGQEAYSLAMLLYENFPALREWRVRIEGTDIASPVVERAQLGVYQRIEVNRGLPARSLVRYFDQTGEEWAIRPEIRRMCNFRVANLCEDRLPFAAHEKFDVIFLRNVMLYFSRETRHKLLKNIHAQLAPDGYLFLGSSEQPADPAIWTTVLSGGICHYLPRREGEADANFRNDTPKSVGQLNPVVGSATSAAMPARLTEWRRS